MKISKVIEYYFPLKRGKKLNKYNIVQQLLRLSQKNTINHIFHSILLARSTTQQLLYGVHLGITSYYLFTLLQQYIYI